MLSNLNNRTCETWIKNNEVSSRSKGDYNTENVYHWNIVQLVDYLTGRFNGTSKKITTDNRYLEKLSSLYAEVKK